MVISYVNEFIENSFSFPHTIDIIGYYFSCCDLLQFLWLSLDWSILLQMTLVHFCHGRIIFCSVRDDLFFIIRVSMYILFPSLSWLIDILFQCTFGCFSYLNSDVSAFILRNGLPDHVAALFLTLKVTSLLVHIMAVTSYILPVKKKKNSPLFKPDTSISWM